ncbi:Ser/Thr protein kinase RdoA (MazF antagonist) [Povalibacter uvarum]|uniref:Stress response kinase A n=1 Tax=Povalibacter uvarum TaxID=732238 RepID=A0A841HGI0_9GAMM|nr:serine/threonine protein kinase [Povalibacter uvarum]MBB6091674.1 Ser/Thr protein kinase RdoA (MazF antagonist) [Povalibacter uvarum]
MDQRTGSSLSSYSYHSMPRPDPHPYDRLTPDAIIASVESLGRVSDRRILALNSYENRVYQVGIEGGAPIIAKFYRPGRWSDEAIHEEHGFALELAAAEIPVVPPIVRKGQTLFTYEGFRFAIFERRGGRWPELGTRTEREWMGRFLGRMHMTGRRQRFRYRGRINVEALGIESRNYLLSQNWIPPHLESAYDTLTSDLLEQIGEAFLTAQGHAEIRLHGDCHRGNVLWTDDGPHFVDLDDCLMGPAIQDLWMLIAGSRAEMAEQMSQLLEGYTHFANFDHRELVLIESLRTLRMIHYAAWLARRWSDPAFPQAFPWFREPRYWETHVLQLREQLAAIAEGPLEL